MEYEVSGVFTPQQCALYLIGYFLLLIHKIIVSNTESQLNKICRKIKRSLFSVHILKICYFCCPKW